MALPPPLSAHDLAIADAQAQHTFDDGYYGHFEIAKLRASPDNRKRFNEQALQELAESIKAMGVAQAILIRPVTPTEEAPQEFEIVAGERRFRASKIAGKTHIPALCRKLSDLDAAKIRILENLQREDPHPMEEAEGYQLLMLQHGFTADQLVDEVKKSRAYIYGRLKLCALASEVREQFLDNKLSASTALLVARIPVPALQVKAAQEILSPTYGEPMSHRAAASHIQNRYMLKLNAAVFSVTDAKLLSAAGACTKCPKRTGNQPEIFDGIDANVCTDPDCFAEKRAAHSAAVLVQANKEGIPVLEGDEANQTLSRRFSQDSELVTPDMNLWYFKRNAPSTQNNGYVKDFLTDDVMPTVAGYVKKDDVNLTPLYKRVDMQAALEKVGACETVEAYTERMATVQTTTPISAKAEAERKKQAEFEKQATEVTKFRVALYMKLRIRAAENGFSLQSLREITKVLLNEFGLPRELRDAYAFDPQSGDEVNKYVDQAGLPEIQLLMVDSIFGGAFDVSAYDIKNGHADEDDFSVLLNIAQNEGIDANQIREELFPQPIDVTNMQYSALVDFIRSKPNRINELKDAVLHCGPRGDLVGPLEQAATSLGYVYRERAFVLADADASPPAVDQVEHAPAPADETTTAVRQAEEAQPAANQVDGEQLAEQMAEVTPATADSDVQTSVLDKKAKAKPPAKTSTSKKAATPAPSKKPVPAASTSRSKAKAA
jgi:ParB/RepB/Spo0J family partition protein